jgi:hypothetical protein
MSNGEPRFTILQSGLAHGEAAMSQDGREHGEFSVGDRIWTMLDGCILCGRLAHVTMCPAHGASCEDLSGGYTVLYARLIETPAGVSLAHDGDRNRLCEDCIAKHGGPGRQLSAAMHDRLDRLGEKLWPALKRRVVCPLCEMQ